MCPRIDIAVRLMFFSGMITFLSTVGLRVWAQFSRRDETIARVATLLVFTGIVNMITYFNSTPGPASSAHWTHNTHATMDGCSRPELSA